MILIAEAGSSKIDWRFISKEKVISQWKTNGYNPNTHHSPEFLEALFSQSSKDSIDLGFCEKVYFYGSGISSELVKSTLATYLSSFFPKAHLMLDSDLLAAARSLCGIRPGIACILGTGSNSCLFDGKNIVSNIPPLGYILGDFGSGTHLGKELVRHYAHGLLPTNLKESFEKRYPEGLAGIIENVYRKDKANQYLAAFTRFLIHHQQQPVIYKLMYTCFEMFFQRQVLPLQESNLPVHVTGSVGFYFGNILRQVAQDMNISLQTINESPIAGLTLYHLESEFQ